MTETTKIVRFTESVERILHARFAGRTDILSHAQGIAEDLANEVRPPQEGVSLLYGNGDDEVGVTLPPTKSAEWLQNSLARALADRPKLLDDIIERIDDL